MKNLKLKQFVRRCLLMAVTTVFALTVNAIPAKPGLVKVITLENGKTVKARLVGDEFGHYWLGEDGKSYQGNEDGSMFKAVDVQQIAKRASAKRQMRDNSNGKRLAHKNIGEFGDYTGKKKGLIILVNFSNVSFKEDNDNALFQRIANEKDFNEGDFVGSMYDYFYAQSGGKFELTFDVVGPVTVSKKQDYYGGNDRFGNDKHPAEMISEACKLADQYVDYKDYDWDGDGNVEQIYVVYAGKGEADGGAANTIWPHQWQLSDAYGYDDGEGALTLDGVIIDKYACGGELDGQTGEVNGIGTMCHEFSHCLGFPDFYDTDYSGGFGMYTWDLMCSGSYNGDGYRPCGYTSYERWMAGWMEPEELIYTKKVNNMKGLEEGGEAYIIYNEGNRNEYFMFENRKKTGWDSDLPGEGLLIVHVDYDEDIWASNQPNDDKNHQRMTWVPADGEFETTGYGSNKRLTTSGLETDPYPISENNEFNRTSTPAAKFYNKNADNTYFMSSSVEDITRNADGSISFSFVGLSGVDAPVLTPEPGVYNQPVEVAITCEEGAEIYYTTDGTTPTKESTKYAGAFTLNATATVSAIAVSEEKVSEAVSARYIIRQPSTGTMTFRRVEDVSGLESGKRYIIACGNNGKAAGALNNNSLKGNEVTIYDDIIIADENTTVFTLDVDNGKYALYNDEGNFLSSTSIGKLAFDGEMKYWDMKNHTSGVIMSFGTYGNMILYSIQSTFITSKNTSSSMIYANLYEEYEIADKQDAQLSFDETEYVVVLGDEFVAPQAKLNPENLAVVYSSSDESVATVDANTGAVNILNAGTTIISAMFAGDEVYNQASASYTLIVNEDIVNGIETVASGKTHDNSIYTLDGRKIVGGNLPKGIYIRNGRKYVR